MVSHCADEILNLDEVLDVLNCISAEETYVRLNGYCCLSTRVAGIFPGTHEALKDPSDYDLRF
jgi:hypothetical protein